MVATYLWTQRACGTSTIGKDKCGEIGEHATMPLNRLQGTLRCSPTASEEPCCDIQGIAMEPS